MDILKSLASCQTVSTTPEAASGAQVIKENLALERKIHESKMARVAAAEMMRRGSIHVERPQQAHSQRHPGTSWSLFLLTFAFLNESHCV